MEDEHFNVDTPSTFSPPEEAILGYLYKNPGANIGTATLVQILKYERSTTEQQQPLDEIQYAVESLIVAGLVRGKRVSESGKIQHIKLRLTTRGEKIAIKEQRRAQGIRVTIRTMGGEHAGPDGE
jgi:hypothetical protein